MTTLERLQSVFVALAALLGLAAGVALPIDAPAGHVVLPALLLMLTAVFLQMDGAQIRSARHARTVVAASLVINFVWTPLFAWALGAGLLGGSPDLRIGLLLLLVTPCTDWYLVFTALARGHLGSAAALLPINLILQLILLPVYVQLLGGDAAMIDTRTLIGAVVLVLAVPLSAALILRRLTAGSTAGRRLTNNSSRAILPLLYVAVFAMFAWQGGVVFDHGGELLALLLPLLLFFAVTPFLAQGTGRMLRLHADQRVTLTMTTVARNSPIALALAVAAFPDRPLIAVALVIGPLVELPVLAVLSQLVRVPAASRG
ncbi:arsenic resistance protein [Hoyosella subflava]|uniref:Bile acid:sodium symporter n=1 Tax=Hoyosella subflava (strain DSM 45089 / JCM 17490 / NBRC 109087 / DQS3-9A1) TaxID=443218 RepID=F6EM47_HOYSD|nr:arsenic resistance protein [Hoyosella subflava]AEF39253.1 Bile acid:sodium symporter [Hoyosella subflava DQS3-9A1]